VTKSHAQIKFFNGDYLAALEYAKEVNKPLFIDFYADWCIPCKQMEKYSFSDREFSRLVNDKFVVVKVNVENFSGMDVAEKFRISKYPTLIVADSRGREKGRTVGFKTKDELLKFVRPFAK
jgi:thiol:disulfide interchange protein